MYSQPNCFEIKAKRAKTKNQDLSAAQINKAQLVPASDVINKYPNLQKENIIGKLAVKLAKESFFGDSVLVKCTVMGCNSHPALPLKELNELKRTIFSLFPTYWANPVEFESELWTQCVNSIGQLCKRLRAIQLTKL